MKIPENISVKSDTTDLRILKSTFGNFHPLMSKLATKDPVLIRIKQNDFNFRAIKTTFFIRSRFQGYRCK